MKCIRPLQFIRNYWQFIVFILILIVTFIAYSLGFDYMSEQNNALYEQLQELQKESEIKDQIIENKDLALLVLDSSLGENGYEIQSKYDFVDGKIAYYVEMMCRELGIDPDLAFAILMVENPQFDPEAINRNRNGTIDCGLFQLNDKYLWSDFIGYWIKDVELDPFNWKHNAYIALHHLKYLQDKLKITDEIIMAYNCGTSAVMNDCIPESTRGYLVKVKNNLKLLRNYGN